VTAPGLEVLIDGAPLPDAEARAFWGRFSAHMDEHKGDLAGFARTEGLTSVYPEHRQGRAVLVGSRTAPQRAYGESPPEKHRSGPKPGSKKGGGKKGSGPPKKRA
jgi:hypothetical protein